MQVEGMIQAIRDWGGQPLGRTLLLSVALHVAVIMLVQPRFGGQDRFVVLNARLAPQGQQSPPEPLAEEAVVPDAAAPLESASAVEALPPLPQENDAEEDRVAERPSDDPLPQAIAHLREREEQPPTGLAVPEAPEPHGEPLAQSGQAASSQAQVPAAVAETHAAALGPTTPEPAADLPSVPVMQDPNWYWARQVDRRPTPLHDIAPVYPEQARRSGLQGSVVIEVRIDEFGKVHELTIIEADPPAVFDAAVLQAYATAYFTPALRDGRPVRYQGRYRVRFDLE